MELMRYFWDAAGALDPAARDLDEGRRFPLCQPDALAALFEAAGLLGVEAGPIDVPTKFADFDDYWSPFLGGQAPAPSYAMSLSPDRRAALRESDPRQAADQVGRLDRAHRSGLGSARAPAPGTSDTLR